MSPSIVALLDRIVDYAGLFPPAKLDMARTVANYASYARGDNAWALGRLVVPVSRLEELVDVSSRVARDPGAVWRVSALVGDDWRADAGRIAGFNTATVAHAMVIDAIEVRATDPHAIALVRDAFPNEITTFFEIGFDSDLELFVASLAECGGLAKARTGGVVPGAFPAPGDVVRFLDCCRRHKVAFKMTAGLHHPIRSEYRLTYEPDSPTGVMHGFLNVFVAAAFVYAGMNEDQAEAILNETSVDAFAFGERDACWRDQVVTHHDIEAARSRFALGFGSCSFAEPIDELKGLKLL